MYMYMYDASGSCLLLLLLNYIYSWGLIYFFFAQRYFVRSPRFSRDCGAIPFWVGLPQFSRTEVEHESTVDSTGLPYLLFHNSCFLRTLGKKLTLNLLTCLSFYNSCLCSIIVFPPYFSHLPILFYNCVFYN